MVWLSTEADDQSSVHCVIVLTDERGRDLLQPCCS